MSFLDRLRRLYDSFSKTTEERTKEVQDFRERMNFYESVYKAIGHRLLWKLFEERVSWA